MNLQSYLRAYFAKQSQSEKNKRQKTIEQKDRAQDIFHILSLVHEYKSLPMRFRKKRNIKIPDVTQPVAYAALRPYSKNLQERTLQSIRQEAEKDIVFELSKDISLEIGKKNEFYFLHAYDKIGLVDRKQKITIPAEYDTIEKFEGFNYHFLEKNVLFVVTKQGKKGLISMKGQQILPPIYDGITRMGDKYDEPTIKLITNGKEGIIRLGENREELCYTICYQKEPFATNINGIQFAATPKYVDWVDENNQLHITGLHDEKDDLLVGEAEKWRVISWKDKKIFSFLDGKWILREYDGKNWSTITRTEYLGREKDLVEVDVRNGPYFIYEKDGKYGVSKEGLKEILPPIADSIIPGYQTGGGLKFFFEQNGTWGVVRFDGLIMIPTGEYENLYEGGRGFFGKKDGKWHRCTTDENKKEQRDDLTELYLSTDENNHRYIKKSSFKDTTLYMPDGSTKYNIAIDGMAHALHGTNDEYISWENTVSLRIRTDGDRVYIIDTMFINPTIHRAGKNNEGKKYIVVTHTVEGKKVTHEIYVDDLRKENLPF